MNAYKTEILEIIHELVCNISSYLSRTRCSKSSQYIALKKMIRMMKITSNVSLTSVVNELIFSFQVYRSTLPCKLPRDPQNNAKNGSSNTVSGVQITEKCSSRKTVSGVLFVYLATNSLFWQVKP